MISEVWVSHLVVRAWAVDLLEGGLEHQTANVTILGSLNQLLVLGLEGGDLLLEDLNLLICPIEKAARNPQVTLNIAEARVNTFHPLDGAGLEALEEAYLVGVLGIEADNRTGGYSHVLAGAVSAEGGASLARNIRSLGLSHDKLANLVGVAASHEGRNIRIVAYVAVEALRGPVAPQPRGGGVVRGALALDMLILVGGHLRKVSEILISKVLG